MQVDGSQGSAIYADTGAIITSGGTNITAGSGKISVGTGIQISPGGNMEKDPEIESITQDIDKIFSDIENEGK